MKKIIGTFIVILSFALVLWIGASWMDIVADNCHPNPTHSEYNFFNLIAD